MTTGAVVLLRGHWPVRARVLEPARGGGWLVLVQGARAVLRVWEWEMTPCASEEE